MLYKEKKSHTHSRAALWRHKNTSLDGPLVNSSIPHLKELMFPAQKHRAGVACKQQTYFQSSLWKITSETSSSETILVKLFLFLFTRPMKLSDRWRLQTLFFRGTTGNMPAVCTSGFLPNLWVVCTVRFKLLDMFMNLFFHTWLLLYSIYLHVTLHYVMTHSGIWINFQSSFSIATCFRSLVFCSSFLLFYSSFFVYFFASPEQRNTGTCKFTLCCVFRLKH